MRAMVLRRTARVEEKPLVIEDLPIPRPGPKQILVRVSACGICHTELDEIEGRLPAKLPIILGHQIVGSVAISPGQWPGYPRREAGAKAWESPG